MINVSLVVYEDAFLTAIVTTLDLLSTANNLLKNQGKDPAFEITIVGEKPEDVKMELPAQIICRKALEEIDNTDLIIVPAFKGDRDPLNVLEKNNDITQWLGFMHLKGAQVVSLCYACYFLAEAGLLNGKSCTSHWMAVEGLQQRYPNVNVVPDAVITDEDGICTGGGGFSSLNVLSYLIEKYCGREIAIQISKIFSIDLDRTSQSHFLVFQGQRKHEDDEILEAQTYIEEHYNDDITIAQVSNDANMSKRTFIRRFKKATHYTPLEYLQRVKIEAAKKLLEKNERGVGQAMYEVGYNDPKSFRGLFKRFTGLTPSQYRMKYNRRAVV